MIRCVVIDDEQPARELIALHLVNLAGFTVVASFDNALDGFSYLQKHTADLLLLDIQLPRLSGLELIRSLKICPKVILTTAYREFAVEAFELEVMDYLVKPVTQERFMKAISRFHYYHHAHIEKTAAPNSIDDAYIFLKVGNGQVKIYLRDILYIEGLKDFTKVHTTQKMYVASERISYMEDKLPESKFSRIHKSFLIALDKIERLEADQVLVGGTSLPIGRVFKNEFMKKAMPRT